MSVEERLAQLAASIDAHPVDTARALMEVETMAIEQKTRRNVLVAVVAAAVVVIAGLVWGSGLLDTSGGETDTAVASAPKDADGQASVTFTGDDCVYTGPTEFTVGDTINITAVDVAEERNSVGYTLSKAVDGTTVAEAQAIADAEQGELGDTTDNSDDHAEAYLQHQRTEQGTERTLSHTLDLAGTWQLNCFIAYEATFVATTFEVVE